MLFLTALNFIFTTRRIHNWASFLLWLSLFILSRAISPLFSSSILCIYQSGGLHLSVSCLFVFSYYSWCSQGKNAEVICHCLLQWTTFYQTWLICLGWSYTAWLIVSMSYRRLWSMWSFWLVFCDCGFHSVCPLMDEDKRLVQASWWEGLAVGKTESCSEGQGLVQ